MGDQGTSDQRSALLRWLVPAGNPSGAVYGLLVVGTLLAAEDSKRAGYLQLTAAVLLALALYWFAHAYATVLGQRLGSTDRWSPARLLAALRHEFAIVRGSLPPVIALIGSGLAGADVTTGVAAALGVCGAWVILLEIVAGVGEGLTASAIGLEALVGAAIGLGLFGVRILLH